MTNHEPGDLAMIAFVSLSPTMAGQLQTLIRLNLESQRCFRSAGDRVEDAELTAAFYRFARQRGSFAAELSRYVEKQGEVPPSAEVAVRAMTAVQRWWQSLRQRLTKDEVDLVLRLAERAQQEMREAYDYVLRQALHPEVVATLERHRDEVAGTSDRLRSLHAARTLRRAG